MEDQKLILKQNQLKALEALERKKKLEKDKIAQKEEKLRKIKEDEEKRKKLLSDKEKEEKDKLRK